MRVGVVCEGPTDFYALKHFLGPLLNEQGREVVFVPIQPQTDNTSPEAGWGNVLLWLERNPPEIRVAKYFAGGLFADDLGVEPLTAILFQLDTDIIGEQSFEAFIESTYDYTVGAPMTPSERADTIERVLKIAWKNSELSEADQRKHVAAPAVESTETWCIAAFSAQSEDFELLAGQELTNRFMTAFDRTFGRQPQTTYANVNKSIKKREQYCIQHQQSADRVELGCNNFRIVVERLRELSQ